MISSGVNRLRIGGMNSGLDTEAIVDAMVSTTKLKMNNNQRKTLKLQAQQTAYRGVISKLQNFQNTFFNVLDKKNFLKSPSIFTQTKATTYVGGEAKTPTGVTVSTSANAAAGSYDVKLIGNATQTSIKGISFGGDVKLGDGEIQSATTGDSFAFSVKHGNTTKVISVTVGAGENGVEAVNRELKVAFGKTNSGDGIVKIASDGTITATDRGTLSVSNVMMLKDENTLSFDPLNLNKGANSFKIIVEGREYTAPSFVTVDKEYFNALFDEDGNYIKDSEENSSLRAEFEAVVLGEEYDGWKQSTSEADKEALFEEYYKLKLDEQIEKNWKSEYNKNKEKEYQDYSDAYTGPEEDKKSKEDYDGYTDFETFYDGEVNRIKGEISNAPETVEDFYNYKLNNAYDEAREAAYNDYITTNPDSNISLDKFEWKDDNGDKITAQKFAETWEYKSAEELAAELPISPTLQAEREEYIDKAFDDKYQPWKLDKDMFRSFSYKEADAYKELRFDDTAFESFSAEDAAEAYNKNALKTSINKAGIPSGINLDIKFENNEAVITATREDDGGNSEAVLVGISAGTDSANSFGISEYETKAASIDSTATLGSMGINFENGKAEIEINSVKISLSSSMTVSEMMTAINTSDAGVTMGFSALTGTFTLTSKEYGTSSDLVLGADTSGVFDKLGLKDGSVKTDGKNLTLSVNGQILESASNSYTMDGTTFTFSSSAAAYDEVTGTGTSFKVDVTANKGGAVDAIKNFVNEYNKLIEEIYGVLQEKPVKGYHFLTEDDIEDNGMSERQVEKWEKLSEKGVLYGDSAVSNVMTRMRDAMMTKVTGTNGKDFSLYSIMSNDKKTYAIKPASDYKKNGMLEFDEDALSEALERNPDDIIKLFTGKGGLMEKLESELNRAVKVTVDEKSQGSLIRRAGIATGTSSTTNEIYRALEELKRTNETLQSRYDRQYDRYWKAFTAMEKQYGALNSQSSYITNMFANM